MPDEQKTNTIDPGSFAQLLSELLRADSAKETGVAGVRNIRKRFEKLGCNMRGLDLFLRLRNMEDADREAMLMAALRYSRWAGLQMGETLDMFAEKDDRGMPPEKAQAGLADAQAYEAGFKAGKAGRPQDGGGMQLGTSPYAKWVEGWSDGQAVLIQNMGDGEGRTEASGGRGRRRRAAAAEAASA